MNPTTRSLLTKIPSPNLAVSASEAIVFMGIPSVKAVAEDVKSEGFSGVAVYELDQDHHEPIVSSSCDHWPATSPERQLQGYQEKVIRSA
jgi:hypothetical protein